MMPVILVIDEVDVAVDDTLRDKISYDPRLLHTANKASFNLMLDTIGETRYVIALYTSEKIRTVMC
jgi:hypothetical protein